LQHAEVPAAPADGGHTVKILVSQTKERFCDGEKMDSAGYRKTITAEKTVSVPLAQRSEADKLKSIAVAATSGMCQEVMKKVEFKVQAGVVRIPPIAGWAGISITMCTCRPEVEVNLLRVPGVSKIVWE
jgi:hypothetical protein